MLHMWKGVLSYFAPVYSLGRRRKKYATMIMSHTHCVSVLLVERVTAAIFRSTMMGTGFTRLGGVRVLLHVEANLETEADIDLSVLPVSRVRKPQCRERLANQPYGILSCVRSYWNAGLGDIPSPVVLGKYVEDGDRVFITNK